MGECCDIPGAGSEIINPSFIIIIGGVTIVGIRILHFTLIFSILLLFLTYYIFSKPTYRSLSVVTAVSD